MATDPDRQSNGRPARQRRRTLSAIPIHAAFQLGWAVAIALPVAAKVSELAHRSSAALAIIELTGIWALVAGLAWTLRVTALTGSGGWGVRARQRVREHRRRGVVEQ